MKKIIFLLLVFSFTALYGQKNWSTFKIGYFNPEASEGGLILGYQGGKYIDEFIDIGWSVDWFHKNYVDKSLANQLDDFNQPLNGEVNMLRAKTNLHEIPALFNITAYFGAAPKMAIFANVGVGAEMLLVFYRDYENPDDDNLKAAFDFSWRIGAGIAYQLGRKSELIAELGYHASSPSWEFEVEDSMGKKHVFEREYDMSGIMLRAGIKIYH